MPFSEPLRLLQVAPRFSGSPNMGAELRNFHLAAQLAKRMMVTHIGFSLPGDEQRAEGDDPRLRFLRAPRAQRYRRLDLLRGALGPVPFPVLNYTRPAMKQALERLLAENRFDIVLLEQVHMGGYVPLLRRAAHPPAAVVCDWHNIESEALDRCANSESNPARRFYMRQAAAKLARFERRFVDQCDMHVTVSERDRRTLESYGGRPPAIVIENGVSLEDFSGGKGGPPAPVSTASARFRLIFVGTMDYYANVDGVKWFAQGAWREIHRLIPQSVFTIVGRNPGAAIRELTGIPGIEVTGTVPDVRPYYSEAFAAVVPLRVGGGTRIKILESMAAGVPVVSTGQGAEGLAVTPGANCILAESFEDMRDAIVALSRDAGKAAGLARAGRDLVRQRYDWASLGEALAERLVSLIEGARSAPQ